MKTHFHTQCFVIFLLCLLHLPAAAQTFIRSELPAVFNTPWEIAYGPDNFLWLSESGGKLSRVDPAIGTRTVVYTAPDYFGGSPLEQSALCFQPVIGAGTLGMALHPDFTNPATAFIYFVYSYNSGSTQAPATRLKVERITWNSTMQAVTGHTTLVSQLPIGYDHFGGRLLIAKKDGTPYLFLTIGDNGISEQNNADCYSPQSSNPNNLAQDPAYKNGKIHRFHLDGSIPADNPIAGNSFFTRGHRNPQGLMYNHLTELLYDIEHGDRTDDEINVLQKGMNYGWKYVRGYHADNNFPGEAGYVSGYTPHPQIAGDALKEPVFTWCSTSQPTTGYAPDWCTIAPSDGLFYSSPGIPDWTNSLLIVTLKKGATVSPELYQLKLNASGLPDMSVAPNPRRFFGADYLANGRLRDLTVSPDGKKIYLINNGGAAADKITVYTYQDGSSSGIVAPIAQQFRLSVYAGAAGESIKVSCSEPMLQVALYDLTGRCLARFDTNVTELLMPGVAAGTYICHVTTSSGKQLKQKVLKE